MNALIRKIGKYVLICAAAFAVQWTWYQVAGTGPHSADDMLLTAAAFTAVLFLLDLIPRKGRG